MPRSRALALGLLLAATPLQAATIASVFSGRIPCTVVQQGVQFCSGDLTNRIETFDGVPLDTNVTLPPASMDGPFPLIVDLHGWSLGKTATCGKKPCWKAAGDGFTYADAKRSTGVQSVRLTTGTSGAASVTGRGPALGISTQPTGSFTLQLVSDTDCWTTRTVDLGAVGR